LALSAYRGKGVELMMEIKLPKPVGYLIEVLNENGFEAFVVGGSVRDSLLGKTPKDWDLTTNAIPEKVQQLFPKTIATGLKHGTITVLLGEGSFEITTYRLESEYQQHRWPVAVNFTNSLEEDLGRRDFTINALAYHPQIGLRDPYGGQEDLKNQLIKAVGEPEKRFEEDALRMLRGIRFAAQLGWEIETNTWQAIIAQADLINWVSAERVRDELDKILCSVHPEKIELLHESGLLREVLPEVEICYLTPQHHPYHLYNVAQHLIKSVCEIEAVSLLRWTMFLHDLGKPGTKTTDAQGIDHFYEHQELSATLAEAILNRLRFEKRSIDKIFQLIKYHDLFLEPEPRKVRKVMNLVGVDLFWDLLKVKRADCAAQNLNYLEERLLVLDKVGQLYTEIQAKQECITLKDLAISGRELLEVGFQTGPELGKILAELLQLVIDAPDLNQKETLMRLAKALREEKNV